MADAKPMQPSYRPIPEYLLVVLILAEFGIILADRHYWFGLTRGDLRNIQLGGALIVVTVLIGLLWAVFGLMLRRRFRFRFRIRSLLLLTLAATIPCGWYAAWKRDGDRQQKKLAEVREIQARILQGTRHRQPLYDTEPITIKSGPRQMVVGVSFAIEEDLGCGCCYGEIRSDIQNDDLSHLADFHHLERLEVPNAKITDEGLVHLQGSKNLRHLNLQGNAITDTGTAHLCGLTRLEELNLSSTDVTDAAFLNLRGMQNLKQLGLDGTATNGSGVKHLGGLPALKEYSGPLSPDGACMLNELKGLEVLISDLAWPSPGNVVWFDKHPSLRYLTLRCGLPLESVRLSNLPALQGVTIGKGLCRHRVTGVPAHMRQRLCKKCLHEVKRLELANLPRLNALHINDVHHMVMRNVPNVRQVVIRGVVTEEHIRSIGKLPQLTELCVFTESFPAPNVFSGFQARLLRRLTISGAGLTDASLAVLDDVPALRQLSLPSGDFSAEGLAHLKSLPALEQLVLLGVSDSGEPLASLVGSPRMKSIVLTNPEFGKLRLVDMPSLKAIRIIGGRIAKLELANLPALSRLEIEHGTTLCQLSVKNLPVLKSLQFDSSSAEKPLACVELEQLPGLSILRLQGAFQNPVLTDECLAHVATFRSLTWLDVKNTLVTDRSIEQLLNLPALHRVDIQNTLVTEAAARRLRETGTPGIEVNESRRRR